MYGWSNITVEVSGRRYNGQYLARDKVVEVASAYGSRTVEISGRDPKVKAEEVLRDLASQSRH